MSWASLPQISQGYDDHAENGKFTFDTLNPGSRVLMYTHFTMPQCCLMTSTFRSPSRLDGTYLSITPNHHRSATDMNAGKI